MAKLIKKQFLKYMFPKHLRAQIVVLSVCIMTGIFIIQVLENTHEYIEESLEDSVKQGRILVRNIAATSSSLLYENDFAAIEEILLQSSAYPNISGIQVTNQHGMVISNVRKNKAGDVVASFDQTILTPPSEDNENLVADDENNVYIWGQIGNGLGWVKLNYSIDYLKAKRLDKIAHSLLEVLLSLIITIVLLVLFLRKPIMALKSITKFSATLGENQGVKLKEAFPSIEIQNLVNSLNMASEKLHKNNQESREEIGKLTAYKFSTDQHSIVSITKANGRILYVNENFCNISGYKKGDLLDQNHCMIASGVHPKEFFKDMWDTILDGNIWQGELCNKDKYGKLYWIKSTIVPILDKDGAPHQFIAVGNDITEEKKYRATLEQLSAFPRHNPHITLSIDANGEIMFTNMSAVNLMVQLALAGKSVHRMLPEDVMAFINASLTSGNVIRDIEVAVLDMNWLWSIHPLTEQNMVLCYAVDITDSKASLHKQRQDYQKLEKNYQELKARLDQATDGENPSGTPLAKSSTKP